MRWSPTLVRSPDSPSMNPNLKDLDDDFLYHLGYSKSDGLDVLFGDVKVKMKSEP